MTTKVHSKTQTAPSGQKNSDSSVGPKKMLTEQEDMVLYKQAKYTMDKEIRVGKRNYSGKLRKKIFSSDFASVRKVWKTLQITRHHPPALCRISNLQMAFNEFYCRLRFLGHHNFSGPEVGKITLSPWWKRPSRAVLSSPAEEVQPVTGAVDTVLLII